MGSRFLKTGPAVSGFQEARNNRESLVEFRMVGFQNKQSFLRNKKMDFHRVHEAKKGMKCIYGWSEDSLKLRPKW